jgi:hypothetical protein
VRMPAGTLVPTEVACTPGRRVRLARTGIVSGSGSVTSVEDT